MFCSERAAAEGPAPQTVAQIQALVRSTAFCRAEPDSDDDAECFSRKPAGGGRTNSLAPAKPAGGGRTSSFAPAKQTGGGRTNSFTPAKPAAVTLVPTKAPVDGATRWKPGEGRLALVFDMCQAKASEREQRNRSRPIDCDAPPVVDLTKPRVRPTESQRSLAPIVARGGSSRAAPLPPKGRGKKKSVVAKEQPVDCVIRGRDGLNYYVDASGVRTPCDT